MNNVTKIIHKYVSIPAVLASGALIGATLVPAHASDIEAGSPSGTTEQAIYLGATQEEFAEAVDYAVNIVDDPEADPHAFESEVDSYILNEIQPDQDESNASNEDVDIGTQALPALPALVVRCLTGLGLNSTQITNIAQSSSVAAMISAGGYAAVRCVMGR